MDREHIVHQNFLSRVAAQGFAPSKDIHASNLTAADAIAIYTSQVQSRQLDRTSRAMQRAGQGYYTIGSSGHEGMAAVAAALRPTDMAFCHYRDAAFFIRRAQQVQGQTPVKDILLSFAASSDDPISGGRHKVLGSKALNIPPQTSTIASHLPKALGAAYSVGLAKRNRPEFQVMPEDAIISVSFGDASANHSTAQGAFNTACWTAFQNVPLPLLFICEDNGIGISTTTPAGWIAQSFSVRPGLKYFACDGLDLFDTFNTTQAAAAFVRLRKKPAFLHIRCVRLLGHAGSDVETTYRAHADIEADEAADPLINSAALLINKGWLTPEQAIEIYTQAGQSCANISKRAVTRPRLKTAKQVMASIVPPKRRCAPSNGPTDAARATAFGSDFKVMSQPQTMNKLINWALTDLMLDHSDIILAGEDIAAKGGVYGVTNKLVNRFGRDRVINTILDEQSILGLAVGLAHNGFLPIPEIQFLAYLHNAEDQIRGEAATLPFFSNGQFTNPMVLRVAGLGYQRGFGGHFHNDNSLAVLRDIPGLIVACPSDGADAVRVLRECVRLAREEQRVVVFVEPIALYTMKDLHAEKDGGWLSVYPDHSEVAPFGDVAVHGTGKDIAIVTYGNGFYLSRQAAKVLRDDHDIASTIIDLRWLLPLPADALLAATKGFEKILFVDECRKSGNVSEELMTLFAEKSSAKPARLTATDSFIATGPAFGATLPSRDGIVEAALTLLRD